MLLLLLLKHTRHTPGKFTHTCDLAWVESLQSSSCDTVSTRSTTRVPNRTTVYMIHWQAVRLHFPIIFIFCHVVPLWTYKVLGRLGLNAKRVAGFSKNSITLSRCYFWPGMPLKRGMQG